MSIIVSNCQHCDEQQFRTLSCVHYTIFSVVKSDLFVRALLLDRILVIEKTTRTPGVHLVPVCEQLIFHLRHVKYVYKMCSNQWKTSCNSLIFC